MKQGDFVRIEAKSGTLGKGYWIAGAVVHDVDVGLPVRVLRVCRNGVAVSGVFETSPVIELGESTFRTANSEYAWEFENPELYEGKKEDS